MTTMGQALENLGMGAGVVCASFFFDNGERSKREEEEGGVQFRSPHRNLNPDRS